MIKPEELRAMLIDAVKSETNVNKATATMVLEVEDGEQLHFKFDLIVSVLDVKELNPGDEGYKEDIE